MRNVGILGGGISLTKITTRGLIIGTWGGIKLPARKMNDGILDMTLTQKEFRQCLDFINNDRCMFCWEAEGPVCNDCMSVWTEVGCGICGEEAGALEDTICSDCKVHRKCWLDKFNNQAVLQSRKRCEICSQPRRKRSRR